MVAVFSDRIQVDAHGITNPETIVWLWHTSLGTGINGQVQYRDGVKIENGDITRTSAPTPLKRGRTYYWAVWSWDEDHKAIEHSSIESEFFIAN